MNSTTQAGWFQELRLIPNTPTLIGMKAIQTGFTGAQST